MPAYVDEYEDVTRDGKLVQTAKMQVGTNFKGKLVGLATNAKYPDKQNLLMEETDGTPFTVFTSGSLGYAVKDGKLEIGQTYRITRLENKATKSGASRTQFKIERLKSNGTTAAPGVNDAKPAGKSATK